MRRGLGKGLGMGYKNIAPMDSHIHSLSAKGVKTYNQCKKSRMIYAKESEFVRLRKYGDDYDITVEDLKEMEKITSSKVESIEGWYDNKSFLLVKFDDGQEWVIAPSEDDAEELAKERVMEDLENEPELFTQSWLRQFITLSDTDRRVIAGEESDNIVDNMSDDDILEETDNQEEYDEIQEEIDELMEKEGYDEDKVTELENKQENLIDDARETLREDKYDEIYDELENPYDYFVEEQGLYTPEEFFKQFGNSIDYEEATEDAINQDGWQHFLSRYDGNSTDLVSGKVAWREN